MRTLVTHAQARHFQKWPILGIGGPAPDFGPVATTYSAEIDSLKNWIAIRLRWLDAHIPGTCNTSGIKESQAMFGLSCYPNPAREFVTLAYELPEAGSVQVRVYSCLGNEVLSVAPVWQSNGKHSVRIDTKNLPEGVYVLHFQKGDKVLTRKIVLTKN